MQVNQPHISPDWGRSASINLLLSSPKKSTEPFLVLSLIIYQSLIGDRSAQYSRAILRNNVFASGTLLHLQRRHAWLSIDWALQPDQSNMTSQNRQKGTYVYAEDSVDTAVDYEAARQRHATVYDAVAGTQNQPPPPLIRQSQEEGVEHTE